MEKQLYPELVDYFRALAQRLGKLREPVHAYLAGGVAVNYHTSYRTSDDVDVKWSHRFGIPGDLQSFVVPNLADPMDIRIVQMDFGFSDSLGTFHPDWQKDSDVVEKVHDFVIHVISPLDLAVSKIGRFIERDREDIRVLAEAGLIRSRDVDLRAKEALDYFIGDTTFLQYNLRDTLEIVRIAEDRNEPGYGR